MSKAMEQQLYYQQNPLNSHINQLPPEMSQQYYQMNGSVNQMTASSAPNPALNQSYYGQQMGQSVGSAPRPPLPKISTPIGSNFTQMSATLPSQSMQSQRQPHSSGTTDPMPQQMNNLSEQMSNISFSGSQQQQTQQPISSQMTPTVQSSHPQTSGPFGGQSFPTHPMTLNARPPSAQQPMPPPQQQQLPPHSSNIGHQSWSRPPMSGPQSQPTSGVENWNSGSVQTSVRPQTQPSLPTLPDQRPVQTQSIPQQMRPQIHPQMNSQMGGPMTGQMPPPPMAGRYPPSMVSQTQLPPQQMPGQMQHQSQMPGPGYMPPPGQMQTPGQMPMPGQMPPHGQMPPPGQMPPQSGQMAPPSRYGPPGSGQPLSQPNYQQTQQRLDPEAMPSVVQVIEEDKVKYENNDNVVFTTSIPASVPPLVTTISNNENTVTNDGGSARPHHLRSTVYQVPINEDTLKITNIPLAIVVQPFDDSEVDLKNVVPITNSEILRCNRCKAYMNPYMRFVDGGRRFQCSLCHHLTEVTPSYFANLDHTGQRLDKFSRPELFLGSYEFRATDEYCRNGVLNARRPHIIFAIELTATSKPIIHHLSTHLSDIIKNFLPRDPLNPVCAPPLIGFLTYNSKIQIYDIINNGHSHIICDVSSTFPPMTTFLVDPLVHFEQIESFLQSLPSLYANEELDTQTVLGPVIEAALLTAQVDSGNWFPGVNTSNNPSIPVGKIYVFHCTLPTFGTDAETPGRLKPRWTTTPDEIRKLLGTDKEKTILVPDSKYYIGLGQRCVTDFASGVELFLFPPINGSYLDVATLGELVRLTGTGTVFKYFNDFSERFLVDLKYSLRSTFAFDAIMKVRTSTGIRAQDYIGNFYARTTSDIECAVINTGCNIAIELKYDDKLPEDEFVVIQVAILYTGISGERRVRVHNMALSTCQQVADIYRNACCDTTINVLVRQGVWSLRNGEKSVQQSKELLINRAIHILTAYRRHCAQPGSSLGQLILPEALKLLPMYVCGALKCDAIDGGPEMTPDDKAFAQIKLLGALTSLSQVILYPRLLKIECDQSTGQLTSTQIRCSSHKLVDNQAFAYLLENGFYILLYIPNAVISGHNQFLSAVFGSQIDSISKIQPEIGLPKLLTNESNYLNQLIENIENIRRKSMRVYVIRQGIDKLETIFRSFLYEDKKGVQTVGGGDSASYVDLLCHLHKEIRSQLN